MLHLLRHTDHLFFLVLALVLVLVLALALVVVLLLFLLLLGVRRSLGTRHTQSEDRTSPPRVLVARFGLFVRGPAFDLECAVQVAIQRAVTQL